MTRRDITEAVFESRLEWPARLLVLTLLSCLDEEAEEVADLSLSLSDLANMSGLARSSVTRWLAELDRLGWISRTRPALGAPERTRYRLMAGEPGPVTEKPTRTYRKKKIGTSVRLLVALRYGAKPGEGRYAPCHHCGVPGWIEWPLERKTAHWVVFEHELDHLMPEVRGGATAADNIVLACPPCNRRKGSRTDWTADVPEVAHGA